ncbi:hypothetical protein DdX_22007 [Ditylenchus destructor]|uniref:Uncharacterized protein n=1 Tax=Ditylenchus destructor TaxID=166010 RepID=A0AAD4QR44_9BILA|nr:hypothetical protein DdX_22007 [Ditylenchus destructor]
MLPHFARRSMRRNQKILADPHTQFIHAIKELREIRMQPRRQNFVDARILQIGQELPGAALRFSALLVLNLRQVVDHLDRARMQRAGHVRAKNEQFGHALWLDHVAVNLAVDLEGRDAAQDRAPVIEVVLLIFLGGGAEELAVERVELHVDQARCVVRTFEEGAQAREVEGLVLQHGAQRDTARQCERNLTHSKNWPGSRSKSPERSMRLTSSQVVFCVSQASVAGDDGRSVALVLDHEFHHLLGRDLVVLLVVPGQQFADGEHALPAVLGDFGGLRQERGLVVDVQHARRVLGALGVAGHPIEVVCGAGQHRSCSYCDWLCDCAGALDLGTRSASRIQVSFVPPPCDELTTSEPSFSATRVSPPGTICTSAPESTKGRRSMWRGAMPASTKVGEVDRLSVGWAM